MANNKVTKTSTTRRLIKLKEWGINEHIVRSTANSSAIERELNFEYSKHIQILNSSMSGMNLLLGIFTLLAKIVSLGVGTVVYVCSSNDWRTSRLSDGRYYTKHKNLSIFAKTTDFPKPTTPEWTQYRKFLHIFSDICLTFDIKCVFCTRPFPNNSPMQAVNDLVLEFGARENVSVVDVVRYCLDSEYSSDDISKWFYDDVHLTTEGSELLGKFFAKALVAEGIA